MAKKNNIKKSCTYAQSIIELSILGAALFGILGTLIQITSSYSDAQATQLQAMREALSLSAREGMEEDSSKKTKHRSSATALWIEDKPSITGGEKYGSASYTPSIAFGTGTFTNLLTYNAPWGQELAIPLMDIYINGQHFTFTTAAYKVFPGTNDGGTYLQKKGKVYDWKDTYCGDYGARKCIHYPIPTTFNGGGVDNPWYIWTPASNPPSTGRSLVFWTKIPWTDKRFCYGPNDPPDHYCKHVGDFEQWNFWARWVLDPVNAPGKIVPDSDRRKMQWQWYPIIAQELGADDGSGDHDNPINPIGIGFFRQTNEDDPKDPGPQTFADVDFDGHEEQIMMMEEWGVYDPGNVNYECRRKFQYTWSDGETLRSPWYLKHYGEEDPQLCDSQRNGAIANEDYKVATVWVLDFEDGDLAMSFSTVDELQGKSKPGFVQGATRVITQTKGDLTIEQKAQGSSANNVSVQKQDSSILVERQIQLSNNTGRLDAFSSGCYPPSGPITEMGCGLADPAGSYACKTDLSLPYPDEQSCCYKNNVVEKTCLDRTSLKLYVRTKIEKKVGHKYKTQQSTKNFP